MYFRTSTTSRRVDVGLSLKIHDGTVTKADEKWVERACHSSVPQLSSDRFLLNTWQVNDENTSQLSQSFRPPLKL